MKRLTLSLLVLCALASLAFIPSGPTPVTFTWNPYAAASSDMVFKVYHSTDMAVPLTSWQVLTNVPGTNTQLTVTVVPGVHFFYLTASNFWGESDASNVAGTPTLPRGTNIITISR